MFCWGHNTTQWLSVTKKGILLFNVYPLQRNDDEDEDDGQSQTES